MDRRTLVRLLVGLGIGIPVLVEAVTLLGLVETRLAADGRGGEGGTAGTPTPPPRRVGVGDELLPATPPTETVTGSVIRASGGRWTFALSVEVSNGGPGGYELRLGAVALGDGSRIQGGASTGRVPPGETATATGTWDLPEGSTPDAVEVIAVRFPDGSGTASVLRERVPLAKVPVRGG